MPAPIRSMIIDAFEEGFRGVDKSARELYALLQTTVTRGREEERANGKIPNALLITFIFQCIRLPDQMQVPEETFTQTGQTAYMDRHHARWMTKEIFSI